MEILWSKRSLSAVRSIRSERFSEEETRTYRAMLMRTAMDKIRKLQKTFVSNKYPDTFLVRVDSYLVSYRYLANDRILVTTVKHMKQK